ncbi:hypothetical protein JMF89_15805 [Clostridiaceae bacterium UIB06]|nr:hypothetical protein [Clostridiaceae bacterium UIB06]
MDSDLKIRVISNLTNTELFYICQENLSISSTNFKVEPWQKQYIAPGAEFFSILPAQLQAQGKYEEDTSIYNTKIVDVNYYHSYELYMNVQGLDIQPSQESAPTEGINIYNKCDYTKEIVVLKGENPILSAKVRPSNKFNFLVYPKLYIYISDYEILDDSVKASSLSPLTHIDYSGQNYLTIILKENTSTGKFEIEYNFNYFEYP